MNGLKKNRLKNKFPRILTWVAVLGPENLTIWVKFCVESEFQVENAQKMRPDPEN